MVEYKYYVHDDENKIDAKEFDKFEDAFDYAQGGLITFIEEIPVEDGVEAEEGEIVWSWDDTWNKEEAIKAIESRHQTDMKKLLKDYEKSLSGDIDEDIEVEITADDAEDIMDLTKFIFGDDFDSEFGAPAEEVEIPAVEVPDTVLNIEEPKEEIKYDEEKVFDDDFEEESEEEKLEEATHNQYAMPEGDKITSYNNALKYAKQYGRPFIYGYTNRRYNGKFFALQQPIKCSNEVWNDEAKFRNQYKDCGTVYVAYPDKDFVSEGMEEKLEEKKNVTYTTGDPALNATHFNGEAGDACCEDLSQRNYDFNKGGYDVFEGSEAELLSELNNGVEVVIYVGEDEGDMAEFMYSDSERFYCDDCYWEGGEIDTLALKDGKYVVTRYLDDEGDVHEDPWQEDEFDTWEEAKEFLNQHYLAFVKGYLTTDPLEDEMSDEEFVEEFGKALLGKEELEEGVFDLFKSELSKHITGYEVYAVDKSNKKQGEKSFSNLSAAINYAKPLSKRSDYKFVYIKITKIDKECPDAKPGTLVSVYKQGELYDDHKKEIEAAIKNETKINKAAEKSTKQASPEEDPNEVDKASSETQKDVKEPEKQDTDTEKVENNEEEKVRELDASENPTQNDDAKPEETPKEEEPAKQEEPQQPTKKDTSKAQAAREKNDAILNALKNAGADQAFLDKLTTKDNKKQRTELNKLRKALFGESLEEK